MWAASALKWDARAVRAPDRFEQVVGRVHEHADRIGADPDVVEATCRAMIAAFFKLELRELNSRQDQ